MGTVVKNFYLDEIPQFFSVLKGEMSIVGPRPLSVLHTERDAEQGNVTRKLIKGGLLGLGHINKGTSEMGNPIYEYEYIDKYMNASDIELLFLDLKIIYKGILLIFKGDHGLNKPNRRFYYNSLSNLFEPIYYDGIL